MPSRSTPTARLAPLLAAVYAALLACLAPFTEPALAQGRNFTPWVETREYSRPWFDEFDRLAPNLKHPHPDPLLITISLNSQNLRVFDRTGQLASTPISSGRKGFETPEGIFSIIERKEDHFSNLYDDAYMPFMQRLTWSGVALHGGQVPGYPASHGCVRLPDQFAAELFGGTRINSRVVITPHETVPQRISHPTLPQPRHSTSRLDAYGPPLETLKKAAAEASERAEAANKALQTAQAQLRQARTELPKARQSLQQAERSLQRARGNAQSLTAEQALDAARARMEAVTASLAEAEAVVTIAEERQAAAAIEARDFFRLTRPVSVLISRQEGRLYVRQVLNQVLEVPIEIRDPDQPIGTHLLMVLSASDDSSIVDWSSVTAEPPGGNPPTVPRAQPNQARYNKGRAHQSSPSIQTRDDSALAKAALNRITIPEAALDRIAPSLQPGSVIIITDHPPSIETGQGTDFVVQTRGEEQAAANIAKFNEAKRLAEETEQQFQGQQVVVEESVFVEQPRRRSSRRTSQW